MIRYTILLLICGFTLGSCSVEKFCNERYPPQVKDSSFTKTDTIVKWDTVKVPETSIVFDTTLDFLPKNIVFHHEEKKGSLTSGFSIKDGKIKTLCKADSLGLVNKHLKEIVRTYHEKKETKEILCSKKHRTTYDNFCRWFTPIMLLLILIAIVIKCFRG